VVSWRWQASPTKNLGIDRAADRWAAELIGPSMEGVAAWTELREGRLWFVVQARVPDVQTWRELQGMLVDRVGELVGDVPIMFLPVDLVREPDGSWAVEVEQVAHPTGDGAGRWTLEVRSHEGPDRSSTANVAMDGSMRWSESTVQMLAEGRSIRATVRRAEDGIPTMARTAVSAAFALAGLLVLGWVMRRTNKLAAARK
jgi:hypothetical protein